jgi:hypothetical protein
MMTSSIYSAYLSILMHPVLRLQVYTIAQNTISHSFIISVSILIAPFDSPHEVIVQHSVHAQGTI